MIRVAVHQVRRESVFDAGAFRLALVKRSERHYTTTVSLGRHESLQFTPRDHAAANVAAAMFDMWALAALAYECASRATCSAARFP